MKGNQIFYCFTSNEDTLLLKHEFFDLWNKMLKQMRSDFKEVIVLKKKI